MDINFEPLTPEPRNREYELYTPEQRAKIIYGYLFEGLSHRELDNQYLWLNPDESSGYQAMGILHHLGLRGAHKKIFHNINVLDAIKYLEEQQSIDYLRVANYLKVYSNSNIGQNEKYLMQVIEALNYYGGEATLNDMYSYVKEHYGYDLPDDGYQSSLRKAIYQNSSDANLYQGKRDLFYTIEGKGSGIWGLRTYVPNETNIELTEDDEGFPEGKQKLRTHLMRERNPKVIREAKRRYKEKHGRLFCQVCGFDFVKVYGDIGEDYIEGHHTKPISDSDGENVTMIDDIALLCANCHKMVHRKRPWLTVNELQLLIVPY